MRRPEPYDPNQPPMIPAPKANNDNAAWSLLFDLGMTAHPPNTTIDSKAPREPIGPTRTKTGQYVYVSACFDDGRIISGFLCVRSDGRVILAGTKSGEFVTFDTNDAVSVAVIYTDTPEMPPNDRRGDADA